MTLSPLTSLASLVLHLSVSTATPLTFRLPVLPQLESGAAAAGSPGGDGVTLVVSRPPEVRRLRLAAALSVAGRVDQQLLARLAVTGLSCSPGNHAALTPPRHL